MIFSALLYVFLYAGILSPATTAQEIDPRIREAESQRIAVIEKVRPAVVAIFGKDGQGGGSGVLISKDGYALSNFHVVQGNPIMKCGLADGVLYDAVVVGIDIVGDVALIKMLPSGERGGVSPPVREPEPGGSRHPAHRDFPFAVMGDSEKVQAGDWSLAMGNPFLLATDFTPTVTFGMVSGVHRYQYPSGTVLEYTDCIQVDTSINPGNSGGPLFNMQGEIIGINGRISLEKRGRVNSGVGYAISINQIKNFLGHLRGGLQVDHASLGAVVRTSEDGKMIVRQILADCDARRRGLDLDDELVSFAGRSITTVNHFKNVLGIYPKGWRLPLTYRHRDEDGKVETREILVRLLGVQAQELEEAGRPRRRRPGDPPPQPKPDKPPADSPATKLYEAKPGFANYYFNKLERDRLLAGFKKHGDFSALAGRWEIQPDSAAPKPTFANAKIDERSASIRIGNDDFAVEPLKVGESIESLREPKGSGGLLVALYHWRRLLQQGEKGFEGGFTYGGHEPYYSEGTPASRVNTEVLQTEHGGILAKWYFAPADQTLLGVECFIEKESDPCELTFGEYKDVNGRRLPHQLTVRYGDKKFAVYKIAAYQLGP